ncbi:MULTISPECIES: diacylglycerol kinase family protein [unclassified Meiothermus]|uniref:diacylglycerol/lipid kinase family protein n=1 Tax=unclassified Meiothermus TaxID=370471 RepID=UPI000D7CEC04|nr:MULTISPECIES: diacylglycerol kinase family protein [unclassified Meiothermus]PZA07102.1 diacylglycerol kinase family lipid kinase [Meiothermus sp. Pnk-1]RYM40016.1 diacylglycerol kinase family lipid kinase [Meiothermus sp. PNK-Is4]
MQSLVIVNPAAGRGRVGRMLPQIQSALAAIHPNGQVQVVQTKSPGHATLLAQTTPAERVIAVGGDGTVHEVLRGLAHSAKVLGVVPIGSGNDFARMIGLHRKPLAEAFQIALNAPAGAVDLGEVNGQPFGASLGIGFDAMVARKALTAPTFLRGMPRYLYSIFAVLKELSLPTLTLEAGGEVLFQGKALLVALMNGHTYGGGIPIAPSASPTDGLLSGVVAGEFSRLGVVGILPRLLLGQHVHHPRVHQYGGAAFTVRFDRPVAAHTDGELLEPQARYEVRIHPRALRVALP